MLIDGNYQILNQPILKSIANKNSGGTLSLTVIAVGKGYSDQSSNTSLGYLRLTSY